MDELQYKQINESLCREELLRRFPKVELHRHLEGTFDLETLYSISIKNDLDTPRDEKLFREYCQFPKNHDSDFILFLSKFHNDWYRSHDDVQKIVYNSVKNIKKEGLHYIELRFSPEHFALVNNFDRVEITKIVVEAADAAARETGLKINYLLTFNRGKQSPDEMIELYRKMADMDIAKIVGVDLAGDETHFPPELFIKFFDTVQQAGLHKIDIHAGEVSGPDQIWTAINKLHAHRIGHGVSAVHDEKLQKELTDRQISLCQCVISNFQTAAWSETSSHPINTLFRKGVPVSISSDDPTIQNAELVDDYRTIMEHFSFTFQELIDINMDTINAAFLSDKEKSGLRESYSKAVEHFVRENTQTS